MFCHISSDHWPHAVFAQVYSNTPETINLIIEVFVEVAHKQICYLGEVSDTSSSVLPADDNVFSYKYCAGKDLFPARAAGSLHITVCTRHKLLVFNS